MDELSCAAKDGTGFWYNSCSAVNLNGRIFKSNDDNLKNKDGMIWVKVILFFEDLIIFKTVFLIVKQP